jgi:hypothetical protein
MNVFIIYLKDYFRNIPLKDFLFTSFFVAALVVLNYTIGIEKVIKNIPSWYAGFFLFYVFYLFVFAVAYLVHFRVKNQPSVTGKNTFYLVLFIAPFFFALKMMPWGLASCLSPKGHDPWIQYWAFIFQLPLRLLLLLIGLFTIRKCYSFEKSFFGLTAKPLDLKPYLLVLGCMVPVIAFASVQPDFLLVYPKVRAIGSIHPPTLIRWPWQLLYEISYGIDFITIELFFRGLLVIGLMHFVGIRAILPMAAFYCSVHFGKPLGECISSYFGGLILGVIAYRTRTITGGLLIHLGIAWMMELGGWLGNLHVNSR